MTTHDAKIGGRGDASGHAWAASIEVDGRQKYLFETDKLQEMVGASAIMRNMAAQACAMETPDAGFHVFQPASGEVRAWSTTRDDLLHFAWRLREWLTDRGVEHTAVVLRCRTDHFTRDKTPQEECKAAAAPRDQGEADIDQSGEEPDWPDLGWVHRSLTALARRYKAAKPGSDARPTCSLFEACRIHGFDYANEWNPGEEGKEHGERRRALRGYRARAKSDARRDDRTRRIDEEVRQLLHERADSLLPKMVDDSSSSSRDRGELAGLRKWVEERLAANRAITIGDLVDPSDWLDDEDAGDQFVAFICADGDGMGRLFTGLDWNLEGWGSSDGNASGFGKLAPWKRNRRFSEALDGAVREAFRGAVAEVTLRDLNALKRLSETPPGNPLKIPVLPQLLGGDDLWTIARRDVALRLCRLFAEAVPKRIEACPILRQGMQLSAPAPNTSAKTEDASGQDADESRRATGDAERSTHEAQPAGEPVTLSMSQGIAFAKAGHPVHAMVEAAESLLNSAKALRNGHAWMRKTTTTGCVDWHWIESSLSETVTEARERATTYKAPDTRDVMLLTTRPWTLYEATAFERAAETLRDGVPRRKREQLEDILRRGHVLSLVAWEAWWKRLRECEQKAVEAASNQLPEAWRLPRPKKEKEKRRAGREAARWGGHLCLSPWIDVEANAAPQQGNGQEKPAPHAGHEASRASREPRRYVTPLLDLLALEHLAGSDGEGRPNADDEGAALDDGAPSTETAGEQATGAALA